MTPLAHIIDPTGTLFRLLVLAVFAVAAWRALAPRPLFVVRFTGKSALVLRGSPPAEFISALEDLRQDMALTRGRVLATVKQKRIRLVASSNLPPEVHQRIRNLWAVYA